MKERYFLQSGHTKNLTVGGLTARICGDTEEKMLRQNVFAYDKLSAI